LTSPNGLPRVTTSGQVLIRGGPFTLGSNDPWAYDNERPAHVVDLPPFRIDRAAGWLLRYAISGIRARVKQVERGME
jgi:hypothetical protein